ncbi:DUF3159 domain-containing protein [Saccharothrix coeruleofusca]|uniref:Intracellular septation protein A n=1 Tax=Saccharothrix coeruleofusca TaxID=33919 RepID=A0A918EII0_9PSEU|nr:DUF3159 domain-containing protein [Saccharothrix coeruleofusca]GGP86251.1 hypothetical protein GCM10010185_70000 [Saccharothrix coeruleofusca]
MSLNVLTRKSLSFFGAVGGWRTIAEGVVSRALFLVAYLLTDHVLASALVAVGAVVLFAAVRVLTGGKCWQTTFGLVIVALSALLAGSTGQAVDFYLPSVVLQAGAGVVFLVSLLVRWPLVGVVVEAARDHGPGERHGWRRDAPRLRRYQVCTALFLAKYAVATAVLVPLYLAEWVVPLGVTATLLGGAPAAGVCAYLCWRILRPTPASTTRALGTGR